MYRTAVVFMGTALALSVHAWDALPATPPIPADNPMTPEKIELGKQLFFDPRFSSTGTVSCNTCHNLMLGGDDNRPVSMGVHGLTGPRNAPTVWNSAFHASQFWDGRAASLEEQAKGPVVAAVEMGMADLDKAIGRVRAIPGYRAAFARVFGGEQPVTVDNAAKAVAAFERTLITADSPYDRWAKGDAGAMTPQQIRGLSRFDQLGCTGCHQPPTFAGPHKPRGHFAVFPFHDGPYVEQFQLRQDKGRQAVTGREADHHKYKIPTLRNVALTAPYFHNGRVETLDQAVRVMAAVQLNERLPDADVADIVAFLQALSGEFPALTLPRLPPMVGAALPTE
ncbi:MAG: cytochrome-c peroxidase [Hydrogenophilales bacterium CG_4_10_14_3_um_filter_63_21]|nr:MAG: cytochrome-c peroxidase [Hydrogenophilales bacterium CG_4_10_14_3_um_filter_63_21]